MTQHNGLNHTLQWIYNVTGQISFSFSSAVKTTVIYPATEKHIAKFSQQQVHIVLETPELYEKLTLPHIQKDQFNLQVNIYNFGSNIRANQ